jgi:L-cysteine:1D-myo-inositol 2-amino-2-deoxy-alpha-D-glucopyranoside ligase
VLSDLSDLSGREAVLRLFDTAQQRIIPFEPPETVRIYVCGITPYDSAHMGHATNFLAYDLLLRHLERKGHRVRMVRNVTDVDDSILPKAQELGVDYLDLANAELRQFAADMAAVGIRPPTAQPRATESMDEIIQLVERLVEGGSAYRAEESVYFDVSSFPRYGELCRYSTRLMLKLSTARGGDGPRKDKRDELDFILWKPSLASEPAWDSPFGKGRPGWHVECSAMAMSAHGPTVDLHGGGSDLVFPHHECEKAQSEAATGEPFVKHWMHCGVVTMAGEKMSKSLGNIVFIRDLLGKYEGAAIRLALMRHHYRAGYEWQPDELSRAQAYLNRLRAAATGVAGADPRPYRARVEAALDDDLDVPTALAEIDALAASILAGGPDRRAPSALADILSLLGLDLRIDVDNQPALNPAP